MATSPRGGILLRPPALAGCERRACVAQGPRGPADRTVKSGDFNQDLAELEYFVGRWVDFLFQN